MARILVIDDQELVRLAIRVALEEKDHEVVEAENGEVGFNLQKDHSFDVVVTDMLMPVQEGIETITQLKENLKENFQNLKIIAISGGARANGVDHLKAAVDLGADKVLAKPFTSAELLFNVDACLQSMSLDD